MIMDKKVTAEVRTISQIDIIKAEITQNLDSLEKLLLDNYSNKWSDYSADTRNEDSYCPPSPIVDDIIEEMASVFYQVTNEKIVAKQYWGCLLYTSPSPRD